MTNILFQRIVETYQERMDKFASNVALDGKKIKSLKDALSRNEMTILVAPDEAKSLFKLHEKLLSDLKWAKLERKLHVEIIKDMCKDIEKALEKTDFSERSCAICPTPLNFTPYLLKNICRVNFRDLFRWWTDERVAFFCCRHFKKEIKNY